MTTCYAVFLFISIPASVSDTKIIFIDTEGLFSPNVSSLYDAKLFAITTLLSSEVIYNTVKFMRKSSD